MYLQKKEIPCKHFYSRRGPAHKQLDRLQNKISTAVNIKASRDLIISRKHADKK